MPTNPIRTFISLVIVVCLAVLSPAQAGLTINGTRVVYEEAQGETSVRVRHSVGNTPVIMQSWLDDGSPQALPGSQSAPFILTPAVAHLRPGAEQVIRVLRIGTLPQNQETLFFFNVLEVPPEAALATDQSAMQLSMQARLKFFYRPRGLQPSVNKAPELLRFSVETAGTDTVPRLRITNPTPYHITLTDISLHAAENTPALAVLDEAREVGPMVAPASTLSVYLKSANGSAVSLPARAQVRYVVINDQGGRNAKQGRLD